MHRYFLFALFLAVAAFAQEEKGSLYLVKVNGDTVYGSGEVKERVFGPNLVYINKDSIKVSDVAVLKNGQGYYRHPQAGFGDEELALRVYDGKVIDKYTVEQTGFVNSGAGPGSMSMATWRVALYSKLDNDLKGIDYDNVKQDFWDNEASRNMIQTYERKRSTMWWCLAGGLAAVFASVPFTEDHPEIAGVTGTAGIAALIASFYHGQTKNKYLYKAVERYTE